MDQLAIALNIQQLEMLNSESQDITIFLNNLFAPATDNYRQLSYELQREFKQGGSPEVTRTTIDRVKYDVATHKGDFRVILDINFTFGCEDVKTEKHGQTSEWAFSIDVPGKIISFNNSFAGERSTADEF